MLTIKKVTDQSQELGLVQRLYERAFPFNERKPLGPLLRDKTGRSQVLSFFDGEVFCGFACLLNDEDITHIIYFAIDEDLRGKGYGSLALELTERQFPQNRFIVDIEADDPSAGNEFQRQKRRAFYLKNGYVPSEVRYRWQDENYEVLVRGGDFRKEEFTAFWKHIYEGNQALAGY